MCEVAESALAAFSAPRTTGIGSAISDAEYILVAEVAKSFPIYR